MNTRHINRTIMPDAGWRWRHRHTLLTACGLLALVSAVSPIQGASSQGEIQSVSPAELADPPIQGVSPTASPMPAASAATLVAHGNRAFEAGRIDEALAFYDAAATRAPDAAEIDFNRGVVLFRRGDLAAAEDAFATAAERTRHKPLAAKAHFNLGNTAFADCLRQRDAAPRQALEAGERSVERFQQALQIDPDFIDAARNIEVARLTLNEILTALKEREAAAERQEQARDEAAEQMREMLERQRALHERTAGAEPDAAPGLAGEQRQLAEQSAAAAQRLATAASQEKQDTPNALDKAREHLEQAQGSQTAAARQLEAQRPDTARTAQQRAIEELEKALEALAPADATREEQHQDGSPPPAEQQAADDTGAANDEAATGPETPPRSEPETTPGTPAPSEDDIRAAIANETARDILNEEQRQREMRQRAARAAQTPVDRDW